MDKPEDHGGGDPNNTFCKYCTDETGKLLPRDQVRAKMVQFYIQKQGKTQEEAEKLTDQLMAKMPAWKGEGVSATPPTPPTPPPTVEPKKEPPLSPPSPEPTAGTPKPATPPPTQPAESTAKPATEPTTEQPKGTTGPSGQTSTE